MIRKTFYGVWVLMLALGFMFMSPTVRAEEYKVLAYDFEPYSYMENNQITGLAVEVAREIMKKMNWPDTINQLYPLPRANEMIKADNNIILARLRTPAREKESKWVGPIVPFKLVLFAKRGSGVKVTNTEDIKKYTVGCSAKSAGYDNLVKLGVTKLDPLTPGTLNAAKLFGGRIDLWDTNDLIGIQAVKKEKLDINLLETAFVFEPTYDLSIAFSLNISDEVVAKWQKALDELKANGSLTKIVVKYK